MYANNINTNNKNTSYPHQRFNQLGLNGTFLEVAEEALKHRLNFDDKGNIIQYITPLNGNYIEFLPRFGSKAKKIKRIQNRKTGTNINEDIFLEKLAIVRNNPNNNGFLNRYSFPAKSYTGLSFIPISFGINAISNHKKEITGGTIGFTEGIFKSVAANIEGLEFSAFMGISVFKLTEEIREYLIDREPENIVFLYDADATDISKKELIDSKRVNNFLQSAVNFSSQLLQLTIENNLKTKIFFAQIKPNSEHKGLDDLMQDGRNNNYIDALKEDLTNCNKNSLYFDFIRIQKTTFKKKLNNHFGLTNHVQFYQKFKQEIKLQPFKFGKATYQNTVVNRLGNGESLNSNQLKIGEEIKKFSFFQLINKPFEVKINTINWTIQKYLSEKEKDFKQLLTNNNRIAIQAPTGGGKTRFVIYYAKKSGLKTVITVPTITLCKQVAKEYNVTALHGKVNRKKLNKCLQSNIVVCTYDTLTRLEDLKERFLVVDESHNLVNAYGTKKSFREETVRKITHCFDICPKIILLSGTQNKALCKEFNFLYVDVYQHNYQKVNVQALEVKDTLVEVVTQLKKINFNKKKVHFVYLNNREQLHEIKSYLIKSKILKEEEIDVITRQDANSETSKFYDDIVNKSFINHSAKLILTTCLLAEGVNINNTNIGKVFTVNINCVDSLKQFSARFRKLSFVEVVCIRNLERSLKDDFFFNTENQIDYLKENANLHIRHLKNEEKLFDLDYEEEELYFSSEIEQENTYSHRSTIFPNIYFHGEYKVDILRILAMERERKIDSMNNAAFYTELNAHKNIFLQGNEIIKTNAAIKKQMKEEKKEKQKDKKEKIEFIKDQLLNNDPALIIESFYFHLKKHRSRFSEYIYHHYQKFEEQSEKSISFYEEHKAFFELRTVKALIRAFIILDSLDMLADNLHLITSFKEADFKKMLNRIKTQGVIFLYNNRQYRKHLSKLHRSEARLYKRLTINLEQFLKTKDVFDINEIVKYMTKLGLQEYQLSIFRSLFNFIECRTIRTIKVSGFDKISPIKIGEKNKLYGYKLLAISKL